MNQSFDAQPPRDPRLQQVLDRAATDVQFRGRLLAEPHAAIRDTFGVQLPGGFRLKFIERDADVDALVVLPTATRAHARADGELDEAALETVAGGQGEWNPIDQSTGATGGDWQPDTWQPDTWR